MQSLAATGEKQRSCCFPLSLSLSVFICLLTIISSQDERAVAPLYWNADLLIRNDSETTEDISSYQPILEGLAEEIRAVLGVADVHEVVGVPFTLADDDFAAAWLESYCGSRPYLAADDVLTDFRNDPTRYYGMLRAVDAAEFAHLNSQLAEPIDREKFLAGELCLLASSSIALPETSSLTLESGGQSFSLEIAAEVYDSGDLGASRNIGPDLIVSRDWLDSLGVAPFVTNLSVHYAEPGDVQTEAQVQALLADEPNLGEIFVQSHLAEVQAVQSTEGDLNEPARRSRCFCSLSACSTM